MKTYIKLLSMAKLLGFCSLVFLSLAQVALAQQSFGDGVLGWATIPSGSPYSATPEAACKIQFDNYATPYGTNSTFLGAAPSNNPYVYNCRWTTFRNGCAGGIVSCGASGPSQVFFTCKDGYIATSTSSCALKTDDSPPISACPRFGDPIVAFDAATREEASDFETADHQFSIGRTYRSFSTYSGLNQFSDLVKASVGGWRFNFEPELQFAYGDVEGVTLYLPDGIAYEFIRTGNVFIPGNLYVQPYGAPPQYRYQISVVNPPSDWSNFISTTSQWKVVDLVERKTWLFQAFNNKAPNGADNTFNIARPISVTSAGGYTWTYSYDTAGTLTSIADSYGRTFQFTWNYYPYPLTDPNTAAIFNYNYPVSIGQIGLPGGGKIKYTYDPPLDGNGFSTTLLPQRLVKEELDSPSGSVIDFTTYQYENALFPAFLTGITDARGVRKATFTYNSSGRAISTEGPSGKNKYTVTFNSQSSNLPNEFVRTVTNPLGKVTEYHFTHPSNPNLSTLTSVVGQASANCASSIGSYTYDANGFVASFTDEEGRVTAYVNDAQGRPTSVTRGSGTPQAVTTTVTWDPTYQVATQVVEPGRTTTQTLNATTGLITQRQEQDTTTQTSPYSTNGQTRTVTYGYDGTGRLASVAGPLTGVSTNYAYDPAGFLKTITNELGQVTTVTSANARGQPTAFMDPNGVATALAYDGHGWLTSVSVDTANTPATTTIGYDAVGDVTSITDPIGGSQTFAYDDARRLITVTNGAGEVVTYTRDAMGNATSVTIKNAGGTTTYSKTRTFDELGRIIKEVGAVTANSTYQFGYDRTDNLTSIKDPRSNVFSNGFDALNRLISQTDEGGATVNLTRNGVDAITGYKDPRNITTTYVRNGFGEIIQEVSPDKGTTTYVRDARGLVTQRTDPRGVVTNYTYDKAGRLTGKAYAGQSQYYASLTWDVTGGGNYGIGRLTGISDESGIDWRVFDTKGNIKTYYRTAFPMTTPVTSYYNHDGAGNVTGMNYPSGRFVGFQCDNLGRITNIVTYQTPTSTVGQTIASSITYNPYGGVMGLTHGNGLVETFATDSDYRITGVKVTYPNGAPPAVDRALTWMGNTVTGITDNQSSGLSQTFTYTPANRLAAATGWYGSYAWTYDGVGNRTSETLGSVQSTYAYPTTSNRLASITPGTGTARAFTYDAAGDIVTDTRTGALGLTYQYDVEGRLAKVYQTNATANGATYSYDAQGRLSARTVTQSSAPTSTTTLYVYDLADHLIAELNASGQTQKEYIWLDDMPVAVVDNVASGSPVIYYVHVDHLMRPIRMTDQAWTWVWDVVYAPFGGTPYLYTNPEVMNGRFPGQWFQLETGLHYNWHRHYDPTTGRYLQPDPLLSDESGATVSSLPVGTITGGSDGHAAARSMGWKEAHDIIMGWPSSLRPMLQDGPGVYGYAGGSPLSRTDPNGEQSLTQPFCLSLFGSACFSAPPPSYDGTSCPVLFVGKPPAPSLPRPRDPDCDKEWEEAETVCAEELAKPKYRQNSRVTGGYNTIYECAKGHVSERCGGNRYER